MISQARPVLYVIACGGRPAGQLPEFVRFAQGLGWDSCAAAFVAFQMTWLCRTLDGIRFTRQFRILCLMESMILPSSISCIPIIANRWKGK